VSRKPRSLLIGFVVSILILWVLVISMENPVKEAEHKKDSNCELTAQCRD